MRLAGKICALCGRGLPGPHTPGERLCDTCQVASGRLHRVYMSFMLRAGWYCQFLEADLRTPFPRKLNFSDVGNVRELAEKGRGFADLEALHAFNHGIANGRGGIYLQLTDEQYQKLNGGRTK
jgi:hypothetical protein